MTNNTCHNILSPSPNEPNLSCLLFDERLKWSTCSLLQLFDQIKTLANSVLLSYVNICHEYIMSKTITHFANFYQIHIHLVGNKENYKVVHACRRI